MPDSSRSKGLANMPSSFPPALIKALPLLIITTTTAATATAGSTLSGSTPTLCWQRPAALFTTFVASMTAKLGWTKFSQDIPREGRLPSCYGNGYAAPKVTRGQILPTQWCNIWIKAPVPELFLQNRLWTKCFVNQTFSQSESPFSYLVISIGEFSVQVVDRDFCPSAPQNPWIL